MKKAFFILVQLASMYMKAQNVGIGTTVPTARLQINNNSLLTRPSLLLNDSATAFSGLIKFKNNAYTKGMFIAGFSNSAYNTGQYLDIRSDSFWVATFKGNGSVGINNTEPLFALDVSGDVNITGNLRLNGSTGTAGQVLTSNGTSDPAWAESAYGNNTRFFFHTFPFGNDPDTLVFPLSFYNTNTANVTRSADYKTITINKAGLYHFEGTLTDSMLYRGEYLVALGPNFSIDWVQQMAPKLSLKMKIGNKEILLVNGINYELPGVWGELYSYTQKTYITCHFAKDIYVPAGTTIRLIKKTIEHPEDPVNYPTIHNFLCDFSGYLIHE